MSLPQPPGPKVTLSLPNEYLSPDTLPPSLAGIDEDAKALVAFLLARFAEDEAPTFELVPYSCEPGCCAPAGWVGNRCLICGTLDYGGTVEAITEIAREHEEQVHGRSRVLRDIEAKRRIVEDAWDIRWIMWELAQPYRDHPDFREEWRP